MRKITCDRCGDEYPHLFACLKCNGTGNHVDGDTIYEGQCVKCRGKGMVIDPNEGKGMKVVIETDDSRSLVLNITVSEFYPDHPDFCGKCLYETIKEAFAKL